MLSSNANNLKFNKQIVESYSDNDSTINEIGYGPGIVQKLCARFLQLSKERNVVPLVRSPRFKRRKVSAENNFTVMGEIRHCNTQTFASSKPTSKSFVNATKNDVTFFDGQKCELPIVPPVVVDHVELNSRWPCYDDVVIPGDVKGNLKAKKIESIREKFEKISLTSSSLPPHKKFNKVSFRRLAASTELPSRQLDHRDIGKIQRDCDETIKVAMKLSPPSDDNVTVTKFATVSTVSSLSEQEKMNNDRMKQTEKEISDEIVLQFQPISSTSITGNNSVKMLDGKENGEDGLQEVHRLLKKFDAIREQRAKKCIPEDMSDKTGNRCDRGDYDRLMQLQCQIASPVAIYHSHSSSDSDSHLNPRYNEKKECLKEINLSNRLSGKSELTNAQNFHSEEANAANSKCVKEIEENRTTITVSSSTFTRDDKCATIELKMDDERSKFISDDTDELNSVKTVLPVCDKVSGPVNTTCSNRSNLATNRKSLTKMYLEKKNVMEEADLFERSCSSELSNIRVIKDEGPIRQSLLNLVMDEDVPALMEAMAEKLEFVFEDLTPSVSNVGEGILRNSGKRSRSRPKEARLEFQSSLPTVFTYPDEESAVEKAQWDEGELITFTVYRELCEGKKGRLIDDNYKFESGLHHPSQMSNNTEFPFVRRATLMEEPSMAESLLGVTGRISYNSAPIDLARLSKNTVSLIAGK